MRTWTETRREGTDCGPIDWTLEEVNRDAARAVEMSGCTLEALKEIEQHPERFMVTTDGGCPRFGWRQALSACMYDGWPYWYPRAAVLVAGVFGATWYFLGSITGVRRNAT